MTEKPENLTLKNDKSYIQTMYEYIHPHPTIRSKAQKETIAQTKSPSETLRLEMKLFVGSRHADRMSTPVASFLVKGAGVCGIVAV